MTAWSREIGWSWLRQEAWISRLPACAMPASTQYYRVTTRELRSLRPHTPPSSRPEACSVRAHRWSLAAHWNHNPWQIEGLVIDDYFSVSIEAKDVPPRTSASFDCYSRASALYDRHGLMGSPHKDLIDADEGRVIGAYINSSNRATRRGLVTLSAMPEKRLTMSYLTLLVCQLRHTSDALHLCLIGGWVSLLTYRRPLMSIMQDSFRVVSMDSFDRNRPKIIPLSRSVMDELVLLAALMPLSIYELSAPLDNQVYCTDASCDRGAVLSADISPKVMNVLWKVSKSKGAYSRLLSPAEVLLRRLDALEEVGQGPTESPERPLAFSFEFIEIFSGAAKTSIFIAREGISVGPALDLGESEEYDLRLPHVMSWISFLISQKRLLGFFASPPCTTFSIMRRPRLRSQGVPFGFTPDDPQTRLGNQLAHRGLQTMAVGAQNDSCGILETPYSSYMRQYLKSLGCTEEVRCDSCQFGSPHLKSFRFLGLRVDLSEVGKRCQCKSPHVRIEGSLTKASATYTDALAAQLAKALASAIFEIRNRLSIYHEFPSAGLECQLTNEVMLSSEWRVQASWSFRKKSHINILEKAALLKLCNSLARTKAPVRSVALLDSNVCRCATAKGRTSSLGLSPIVRRVSAVCVAAGIYMHIPFVPTRYNAADDPTRSREVRRPIPGLGIEGWSPEDLFRLALLPKTRRWISNWVRLVLLLLGPDALTLSDRAVFRHGNLCNRLNPHQIPHDGMEFDATLGFPGEGPICLLICWTFILMVSLVVLTRPCRLIFGKTGHFFLRPLSFVLCVGGNALAAGVPVGCCLSCFLFPVGAMAMPVPSRTEGEFRRAQQRAERGPLQTGRPVTDATNAARDHFWNLLRHGRRTLRWTCLGCWQMLIGMWKI